MQEKVKRLQGEEVKRRRGTPAEGGVYNPSREAGMRR